MMDTMPLSPAPAGAPAPAAVYGRYARFYLPLALTAVVMGFTHTVISGALSRTTSPETALAAFSVALGLAILGEAPVFASRQFSLAYGHSRRALTIVLKVVGLVVLGSVLLQLALAYSAAGQHILRYWLNVPPALVVPSLETYRLAMWMVLVSGFRSLYQGVLVRWRWTGYIPVGMGFRVIVMLGLSYGLTAAGWPDSPLLGPIILLSGMATEGFFNYIACRVLIHRRDFKGPGQPRSGDTIPAFAGALRFFLPLAAAGILFNIIRALINVGLARTEFAEIALAAFGVASSMSMLVVGPMLALHQVTVVFGREEGLARPRRFALMTGGVASGLALLSVFTPIAPWILAGPLGLHGPLADVSLAALRGMALLPLAVAASDYSIGVMLLQQRTRAVGGAKAFNLLIVTVSLFTLGPLMESASAAAALATMTQTAAFGVEALILLYLCHYPARTVSAAAG